MLLVSSLSSLTSYAYASLPAGLIHCISCMFLSGGEYRDAWLNEFYGTLTMIFFTFSPGKWIGLDSVPLEWVCHAVGVVLSDYLCGGPHVNPAASIAMFCIGKCSYTEAYVRIMGALAGGLVAFPLFLKFSDTMGWNALGGPEYTLQDEEDDAAGAFLNEFLSTFFLIISIYVLNFELNFGTYHYWIKQTLQAAWIRYLIVIFSVSGPAMNPMLGTVWLIFKTKTGCIQGMDHYFIYWIAPFIASAVASFLYIIYAGGEFMGSPLPFGPVKTPAKEIKSEKKKA